MSNNETLPNVHIPPYDLNPPDSNGIDTFRTLGEDIYNSPKVLGHVIDYVVGNANKQTVPAVRQAICLDSQTEYVRDPRVFSISDHGGKTIRYTTCITRDETNLAIPHPPQVGNERDMSYKSRVCLALHPKSVSRGGSNGITDIPARGDQVTIKKTPDQTVGDFLGVTSRGPYAGSIPDLKEAEVASRIVESYFKKPKQKIRPLSEFAQPTELQKKEAKDTKLAESTGLPISVVKKITCEGYRNE